MNESVSISHVCDYFVNVTIHHNDNDYYIEQIKKKEERQCIFLGIHKIGNTSTPVQINFQLDDNYESCSDQFKQGMFFVRIIELDKSLQNFKPPQQENQTKQNLQIQENNAIFRTQQQDNQQVQQQSGIYMTQQSSNNSQQFTHVPKQIPQESNNTIGQSKQNEENQTLVEQQEQQQQQQSQMQETKVNRVEKFNFSQLKNMEYNGKYTNHAFITQDILGQGAEGCVFQAYIKGQNKKVATKFQFEMKETEKNFITQLINKKPKFILEYYDLFEFNEFKITVFELGNSDLMNYLLEKKEQKNEREIIHICKHIIKGVQELHGMGFIHRDIKPENFIKIGDQLLSTYKLCDLGLIKKLDKDNMKYTMNQGTCYYQAPEILQNSGTYDNKVDIWSLGQMIYELFSTIPLMNGNSPQEICNKIKNYNENEQEKIIRETISPITNNRIPKLYQDTIIKMTRVDPQNRPDINEVYQMLFQDKMFKTVQSNTQPVNQKQHILQTQTQPYSKESNDTKNQISINQTIQQQNTTDNPQKQSTIKIINSQKMENDHQSNNQNIVDQQKQQENQEQQMEKKKEIIQKKMKELKKRINSDKYKWYGLE